MDNEDIVLLHVIMNDMSEVSSDVSVGYCGPAGVDPFTLVKIKFFSSRPWSHSFLYSLDIRMKNCLLCNNDGCYIRLMKFLHQQTNLEADDDPDIGKKISL